MMGAGSVRRLNCSLSDISKPDCSHSLDDQSRTDLLRDLICILEIVHSLYVPLLSRDLYKTPEDDEDDPLMLIQQYMDDG